MMRDKTKCRAVVTTKTHLLRIPEAVKARLSRLLRPLLGHLSLNKRPQQLHHPGIYQRQVHHLGHRSLHLTICGPCCTREKSAHISCSIRVPGREWLTAIDREKEATQPQVCVERYPFVNRNPRSSQRRSEWNVPTHPDRPIRNVSPRRNATQHHEVKKKVCRRITVLFSCRAGI